jgi:hypothetical protein
MEEKPEAAQRPPVLAQQRVLVEDLLSQLDRVACHKGNSFDEVGLYRLMRWMADSPDDSTEIGS